jgi:uncharacterized protein
MPMEKSNRRQRPCPYCGRVSQPDSFPFCSDRCRLIDLSGWFSEAYAIPAEEPPDSEEQETVH